MDNKITISIVSSIMVLSILGLYVFLSWMMFRKNGANVIETKENILRIGLALFIHLIYFLIIFLFIIHVITGYPHLLKSSIRAFKFYFYVVNVIPTFFLIFCYFNIKSLFRKRFKLLNPESTFPKIDFKRTIDCIKKNSERLDLKTSPKILFSKLKDIPPFTFGKTSKDSYICLPCNWNEILKEISIKDRKVEISLEEYVIIHELSHIKHGDHIFMGVSYFFLKSFKYWLFGLLGLAFIYWLTSGAFFLVFYWKEIFFELIYYLIILLLTTSISRNREYLADANAQLFMLKQEFETITKKGINIKLQNTSYAELLWRWFSIFPSLKANMMGITAPQSFFTNLMTIIRERIEKVGKIISRFFQKVFPSHPNRGSRWRSLREKKVIGSSRYILSKGAAIWIGVVEGVFFSINNLYIGESSGILLAVIYENGGHSFSVYKLFMVLFSVFTFVVFFVFIKSSDTSSISIKDYFCSLINRYFIIYVSVVVTYSALYYIDHAINDPYLRSFRHLRWIILEYMLACFLHLFPTMILTASIFIIHNYFLSKSLHHMRTLDTKRIFMGGISKLFIASILMLCLFWLGFSLFGIILGFVISVAITTYSEMKYCPGVTNYYQDWEILYVKRIIKKSEPLRILSFTYLIFLATFCIPMITVSITANYITNSHLLLALMIISWFLNSLILFKFRKAYLPSYSFVPTFIESIKQYLILLQFFDNPKIMANKEIIEKRIETFKLRDYSYKIHEKIEIGCIDATYSALFSLFLIESNYFSKFSAKWLLCLENDDGGFSPLEGLKSRLISTFRALSILNRVDMIKAANSVTHSNWIKSLQTRSGYFVDSISRFPKLEQTYYALESLSLLGSLDTIDSKRCIDWLRITWNECKKSPANVFYSIKCFELLEALSDDIKRDMKDNWLTTYGRLLSNLSVNKNLDGFYYFFRAAEILIGGEKDNLKNLIPGLEENVYNSFIYYLGRM